MRGAFEFADERRRPRPPSRSAGHRGQRGARLADRRCHAATVRKEAQPQQQQQQQQQQPTAKAAAAEATAAPQTAAVVVVLFRPSGSGPARIARHQVRSQG